MLLFFIVYFIVVILTLFIELARLILILRRWYSVDLPCVRPRWFFVYL